MKPTISSPEMKFLCRFYLSLLLLLYTTSTSMAAFSAAKESTVGSSCFSVAIQDFYSNPDHKAQTLNSTCTSQMQVGGAASSPGVLWLSESMNISREQLTGQKLRIGVPIKHGFNEFMRVAYKPISVNGFPVEVFNEVMKALPYQISYEFIPFEGDADSPAYYDELVSQVYYKKFDAVVGDTAITANRSDFVDFTYEYMEAGISLLAPTEDDDTMSPWWFLKPLNTDLWVTTLALAVLKGILVWIFEHDRNADFQGRPSELIGKILSFSFSTFVFAFNTQLQSNYSRFVENLWTFLVFILMTAYTANLTSMLTIEKLKPTVTDVKSLLKNGESIGYQSGSFVHSLLQNLGFEETKLKNYSTVEQYLEALELGSHRGGVSAIMDEIPYLKVFLRRHCSKYTMVGRTYRTGGFGFVFPRGSSIVPDISRAILNFTQGDKMSEIEKKWFGDPTTCPDDAQMTSLRLPLYSLRSIFIITVVALVLAFLLYFSQLLYRLKREEALRETLRGNGLWMKIIAMGQYFHRLGTSLRNSRVVSVPKSSEEFNFIPSDLQMARRYTDIENGHTETIIHHHSLDIPNDRNSNIQSRVKRNYSTRY